MSAVLQQLELQFKPGHLVDVLVWQGCPTVTAVVTEYARYGQMVGYAHQFFDGTVRLLSAPGNRCTLVKSHKFEVVSRCGTPVQVVYSAHDIAQLELYGEGISFSGYYRVLICDLGDQWYKQQTLKGFCADLATKLIADYRDNKVVDLPLFAPQQQLHGFAVGDQVVQDLNRYDIDGWERLQLLISYGTVAAVKRIPGTGSSGLWVRWDNGLETFADPDHLRSPVQPVQPVQRVAAARDQVLRDQQAVLVAQLDQIRRSGPVAPRGVEWNQTTKQKRLADGTVQRYPKIGHYWSVRVQKGCNAQLHNAAGKQCKVVSVGTADSPAYQDWAARFARRRQIAAIEKQLRPIESQIVQLTKKSPAATPEQ